MMKKYNKPEIETLALETIDVIETSGGYAAATELGKNANVVADVQTIEQNIASMQSTWSW